MTKIPTMCKVLNIGAHKDARQNENKIYRHCVGQCEWALRPKEFTVMNVIRAGEYRNNWMFIVSWCKHSPSEQLWWSFFYFRDGRCSSKCHSLSRYLLCQLIFRLSNWQKTNSYVWIIFFFVFHQYKMMIFLSNKEHFFAPTTSLVVEHTASAAFWNAIMLIHAWLLVSLLVQVQSDVCLPHSHIDMSFICAKQAHQKFLDDKLCFIIWIFKHHENQRGRKLSVFSHSHILAEVWRGLFSMSHGLHWRAFIDFNKSWMRQHS